MSVPSTGDDTAFRTALQTYFAAQVPGLSHVYRDQPTQILAGEFPWPAGQVWSAIGFVHIDSQTESRISFGGMVGTAPAGQKQIDRVVSLVVIYQWAFTPSQTPLLGDEWVTPLDNLLSSIKTAIRNDPTFGTGAAGEVFQAGQNQSDIRITRDLPRLTGQRSKVVQWNRVEFDTTTIITA